MSRPARTVLHVAAILAATLSLAACSGDLGLPDVTDDVVTGDSTDGATGDASDPSHLVPEECSDYLFAVAPAELGEVELMPADWPAPPEGSVLCVTSTGGSTETASYALDTPITEVLDYYESVLTADGMFRADGAENGTGYATLDGATAEVQFQVRESDGGFVLAFITASEG